MPQATSAQLRTRPRLVEAAEFESILNAHEIFVSGFTAATRVLPRFIIAHVMHGDRRRLPDIDFTGSDLTKSTFVDADLTRALFHGATLVGCDFRGATLRRADLRSSALAGAQLCGAILDEADLRAAVLVAPDGERGFRRIGGRSDFKGSSLDRAQLDDLVAQGVDFSNCSLRDAALRNANLMNANFTDANLDGVDLTGARLAGVRLQGAILTGVDIESLNLSPDAFVGCVMDPPAAALAEAASIRTIIDEAELWIKTGGARGARGRLGGLDIRVVGDAFRNRALSGLSAPGVMGVGVEFAGTQLQGAVFDGADLRQANFRGADLRGASFVGAKLAHANLVGADVGPLTLPDGRTRPTRFNDATLEGTGLPSPVRKTATFPL